MEPTEMEALELERTASVARYIYNWGLARCRQYYQQHGKSKPWAELSAELTQLKQTELWLYQFLRAPSEVSQVQKKESGETVVSYPPAGADWERIGLCAVDRTGPDSPVASHRIAD
jgi:hypothetical protein